MVDSGESIVSSLFFFAVHFFGSACLAVGEARTLAE